MPTTSRRARSSSAAGLMREAERFFILQDRHPWRSTCPWMPYASRLPVAMAVRSAIEYQNQGYDMFLDMMTNMRRNDLFDVHVPAGTASAGRKHGGLNLAMASAAAAHRHRNRHHRLAGLVAGQRGVSIGIDLPCPELGAHQPPQVAHQRFDLIGWMIL